MVPPLLVAAVVASDNNTQGSPVRRGQCRSDERASREPCRRAASPAFGAWCAAASPEFVSHQRVSGASADIGSKIRCNRPGSSRATKTWACWCVSTPRDIPPPLRRTPEQPTARRQRHVCIACSTRSRPVCSPGVVVGGERQRNYKRRSADSTRVSSPHSHPNIQTIPDGARPRDRPSAPPFADPAR